MIGAFLAYVLQRRLPLLIGSVVVTVLVLVSARVLPFPAFCGLWSLVTCGAVVLASIYDTSDEVGPAARDIGNGAE